MALVHHKQTGEKVTERILGYNKKGKWPQEKFLESMRKGQIFGVANGKAEYGPILGEACLLILGVMK